ncbi:hypothetical protein SAMN05446037_100660 [Anaerovirgula multivorans]|uniref:Concanavalin A-like lectin/glucanases superfamily protein n=1 Tax=Anaerovirgula multivorans TaxID=312168 RepID=A0A239CQ51_9FIRM|nr:hypothetical protein [Anaerovirgula multivorans]SNS21523.1 hypothetical protein SAMN05446037_100660 [Anaerovirgula multivorans]
MSENNIGAVVNNGSYNTGVTIPESFITDSLAGKTEMTIQAACIVSAGGVHDGNHFYIFQSRIGGSNTKFNFYVDVSTKLLAFGGRLMTTDSLVIATALIPNFQLGQVYIFTAAVNTETNKVRLFSNDEFLGEGSPFVRSGVISSASGTYPPRFLSNTVSTTHYASKGLINDVRFWDRALTDEEVAHYHNRYLKGNEEGLVGLYRFDEESGTTVINSANVNYNGTLQNIAMRTDAIYSLNMFKYLVKSTSNIYTYPANEWINTELQEPLTQANFEEYGMDSLASIVTPTTKAVKTMEYDRDEGEGKVYTRKIAPDKWQNEIQSMTVK